MLYEKFVKEAEKLIEQHADKLSLMELTEAWGTIEDLSLIHI